MTPIYDCYESLFPDRGKKKKEPVSRGGLQRSIIALFQLGGYDIGCGANFPLQKVLNR